MDVFIVWTKWFIGQCTHFAYMVFAYLTSLSNCPGEKMALIRMISQNDMKTTCLKNAQKLLNYHGYLKVNFIRGTPQKLSVIMQLGDPKFHVNYWLATTWVLDQECQIYRSATSCESPCDNRALPETPFQQSFYSGSERVMGGRLRWKDYNGRGKPKRVREDKSAEVLGEPPYHRGCLSAVLLQLRCHMQSVSPMLSYKVMPQQKLWFWKDGLFW